MATSNYIGFHLVSSNSNTLTNNTATSNYGGFSLGSSDSNKLTNNTANKNNEYGFSLGSSDSNTLIYNMAISNKRGFSLGSIDSNTLKLNKALNNQIGIFLSSSSSNIILIGNILEGNNQNAQDDSTSQIDPRNSLNYWLANCYSDYQGGGFYIIPGAAGAIDVNPQLPTTDSDGDGIPDWFERKYYLNLSEDDSLLDPDNDGLTNYQEFLLNKDPHTPDSDNIVHTTTVTETSPPSTTTETSTATDPASTVTVPDTTTETTTDTTTETNTETSTTIETSITTIISQIIETTTKTAEGFGLVFMSLTMIGVIFIRRKRQK